MIKNDSVVCIYPPPIGSFTVGDNYLVQFQAYHTINVTDDDGVYMAVPDYFFITEDVREKIEQNGNWEEFLRQTETRLEINEDVELELRRTRYQEAGQLKNVLDMIQDHPQMEPPKTSNLTLLLFSLITFFLLCLENKQLAIPCFLIEIGLIYIWHRHQKTRTFTSQQWKWYGLYLQLKNEISTPLLIRIKHLYLKSILENAEVSDFMFSQLILYKEAKQTQKEELLYKCLQATKDPHT